jgi:hypothetical protein
MALYCGVFKERFMATATDYDLKAYRDKIAKLRGYL